MRSLSAWAAAVTLFIRHSRLGAVAVFYLSGRSAEQYYNSQALTRRENSTDHRSNRLAPPEAVVDSAGRAMEGRRDILEHPQMLTIEPIDPRHSAAIQQIIVDPQMAETSDIPSTPPPDAASGWIARMKSLEEDGSGLTFAIVADDCVVGACGLYRIDRALGHAELGFFVGKRFWRRGYATAAGHILLTRAFAGMGLQSVRASCLAWNDGARGVLSKLGFQPSHEGPPPPGSKFPPTERHQYWSLAREQWMAMHQTAPMLAAAHSCLQTDEAQMEHG